jgi:hypothetical protein
MFATLRQQLEHHWRPPMSILKKSLAVTLAAATMALAPSAFAGYGHKHHHFKGYGYSYHTPKYVKYYKVRHYYKPVYYKKTCYKHGWIWTPYGKKWGCIW